VQKDGPLPLIARMLKLGGEQGLRATITSHPPSTLSDMTTLRIAAYYNDPAVFRLLIRSAPDLLVAAASNGYNPLWVLEHYNVDRSNHAELLSLTRNCVAAYERKDFFSLIRHCGMSRPLAVELAPQVTVWLSLLRHRDDPSIVVSADTTFVVSLLSRLYYHERGIVREIMEYIGPNAADCEANWMENELIALRQQAAEQLELRQAIATQAATNTSQQQTIVTLVATIATQAATIAHLAGPAVPNKRSKPS